MSDQRLMRRDNVLWLGAALLALAALVAFRLVVIGDVLAQSGPAWPTPPPGPAFALPSQDAVRANVRVPASGPDGELVLVRPDWPGVIPLIPPVPSTDVTFTTGTGGPAVTLRIDAGTYAEGVQLRATPASPPAGLGGGTALLAFDLEAFDLDARPLRSLPQRPIRLQLSAEAFTAAGIRGEYLLFAMAEGDGVRWLVTAFDASRQLLTTRLASLGTIVLVNAAPSAR
ncbi:MAG: hypothetical protein J4N31_01085 [Chloroflexi bacterium]|nr:hypothetical protein [Chloroflexota bacterium]MCI0820911.1 hypothetical protein [Chloroflexota bacterium]